MTRGPLRDASWPQLRRATFRRCFEESSANEMGEFYPRQANPDPVLQALSGCRKLHLLDFGDFDASDTLDKLLAEDCWPELQQEQRFHGQDRFGGQPPANTGQTLLMQKFATRVVVNNQLGSLDASLLSGLAHCHDLELLDVSCCDFFPEEAWEGLHEAQWPNLKVAKFGGTFQRGVILKSEAYHDASPFEGVSSDPFLCSAKGEKAAIVVVRVLASSQKLEKLDFSHCHGIPTEAWKELDGTKQHWPQLKEANWSNCFDNCLPSGMRACRPQDFGVVLRFMARCWQLERIDLSWCQDTAQDWEGQNRRRMAKPAANVERCFGAQKAVSWCSGLGCAFAKARMGAVAPCQLAGALKGADFTGIF